MPSLRAVGSTEPEARVALGALAEQLFLISDLWFLISVAGRGTKRGLCGTITLVNELAVRFTPHKWKSTTSPATTTCDG